MYDVMPCSLTFFMLTKSSTNEINYMYCDLIISLNLALSKFPSFKYLSCSTSVLSDASLSSHDEDVGGAHCLDASSNNTAISSPSRKKSHTPHILKRDRKRRKQVGHILDIF